MVDKILFKKITKNYKKMYKLHYANIDINDNIPLYEFLNFNDLERFILEIFADSERCVYLFTFDVKNDINHEYNEIIVTENSEFIYNFFKTGMMSNIDLVTDIDTFFLQKYPSFEDAYKVALDMNEGKELCYNK